MISFVSVVRTIFGIILLSFPYIMQAMQPPEDREPSRKSPAASSGSASNIVSQEEFLALLMQISRLTAPTPPRAVIDADTESFLELVEKYMDIDASEIEAATGDIPTFIEFRQRYSPKKALFLYERDNILSTLSEPEFETAWDRQQESFTNTFFRIYWLFVFFEQDVYQAPHIIISRDHQRELYPTHIHPHVDYLQRTLFTPFFKRLAEIGVIRKEDSYGVIPVTDGNFLGFLKEPQGGYLPFVGYYNNPFNLYYLPYGADHIEYQPAFLVGCGRLVQEKGLIVDTRQEDRRFLRVQGYYGNDPEFPFKVFPHSLNTNIDDGIFETLRALVTEHQERYYLFIPFVQEEDAPYMELLLLEEFLGEAGEHFTESLSLLLNQPRLMLEVPGATETTVTAETTDLPITMLSPPELLSHHRRSLLETIIEEEQQKIKNLVVAGEVKGKKGKNHKRKGKKAQSQRASAAAPADSIRPEDDLASSLRERAAHILQERLTETGLKYRNLLALLRAAKRDILTSALQRGMPLPASSSRVMTDGSHNVRHDSLGILTLVRSHGPRRTQPIPPRLTNRLLDRLLQGMVEDITRAEDLNRGASGSGSASDV